MKRISVLILSATIILLAACGKKGGKSGLMVPKDAAIVIHINSASLSSKLSWSDITQTDWFREMSKEAEDSLAKELLTDPAKSGLDTKSDFVFYMKKQGNGSYLVFQGSLTDASAFEKLLVELKKKNGEQADVKKDEEFSYIASEENGVILWNKSDFTYINNGEMPNAATGSRWRSNDRYQFTVDSLRFFAKKSLTLKGDDNLDSDSRFADLVKDGSDIHIWTSAEAIKGDMGPMASLMKINVLFDDNVSASSFNFSNGKIVATSKVYYNAEMRKLLEKYKPSKIGADVLNRIPSSNVAGVMLFNYPPEGVHEFLKVIGVDGMANTFLAEMNYSVEEFVKAGKGDILLSVSDVSMVNKTDTFNYGGGEPYIHTSTKPHMNILFATSVNDKAAFEKLITIAWGAAKEMGGESMPKIEYKLENNWFAASNSAEQTSGFLEGKGTKQPFADKITGHPFGMYVDLKKIINMIPASEDSVTTGIKDASLNMWEDVVITGGDYSDKALHYSFEVNLVDKNTNSLKQLNQYINKIYTYSQAKKKRYEFGPVVTDEEVPAP